MDLQIELKHQKEFARIVIENVKEYPEFIQTEMNFVTDSVKKIIASGCNIVFDEQVIGDLATQLLQNANITNVSRLTEAQMKKLAYCTGAVIQSSLMQVDPYQNLLNFKENNHTSNNINKKTR